MQPRAESDRRRARVPFHESPAAAVRVLVQQQFRAGGRSPDNHHHHHHHHHDTPCPPPSISYRTVTAGQQRADLFWEWAPEHPNRIPFHCPSAFSSSTTPTVNVLPRHPRLLARAAPENPSGSRSQTSSTSSSAGDRAYLTFSHPVFPPPRDPLGLERRSTEREHARTPKKKEKSREQEVDTRRGLAKKVRTACPPQPGERDCLFPRFSQIPPHHQPPPTTTSTSFLSPSTNTAATRRRRTGSGDDEETINLNDDHNDDDEKNIEDYSHQPRRRPRKAFPPDTIEGLSHPRLTSTVSAASVGDERCSSSATHTAGNIDASSS